MLLPMSSPPRPRAVTCLNYKPALSRRQITRPGLPARRRGKCLYQCTSGPSVSPGRLFYASRRDDALQHIRQGLFVLFHLALEAREFFLRAGDLSAHLLGAAVGVAAFHGAARREQREEVFAYFGNDGLPFG